MNADQKATKIAAEAGERSTALFALLQNALVSGKVGVLELTDAARAAGLLGEGQSVTTSKLFKSAKKALGIHSAREGFAGKGRWFWALPTQALFIAPLLAPTDDVCDGFETSHVVYAEGISAPEQIPSLQSWQVAVKAPASVVSGDDHSQPDQGHHHTGSGGNDNVGVRPDRVPSEWSKGIARLDHRRAPYGVPLHRWRQFMSDCQIFMVAPENWSERARALGWSTESLFGCSKRPLDHLGRAGLLWRMAGGKLTQLYKDSATISAPDGSQRTFHRRPPAADIMLPWMLR